MEDMIKQLEEKKKKISELETEIRSLEEEIARDGWKRVYDPHVGNHYYYGFACGRISQMILIRANPGKKTEAGITFVDPIVAAWHHNGTTLVRLSTNDACKTFASVMQCPVIHLLESTSDMRNFANNCSAQL